MCDGPDTKNGYFSNNTISASGASSLKVFAKDTPENPPPIITTRFPPGAGSISL